MDYCGYFKQFDTYKQKYKSKSILLMQVGSFTLVIAHRLSTIEHANRIVVLQEGRIAEIGSHAQLLAANGVYAHLYHLQFAENP